MSISKILITNNTDGNHAPDQWAMAAAEILADVSALQGQNAIEGQRLVVKIADVLIKHFDAVQKTEVQKLEANAKHILTHPIDVLEVDLKKIAKEVERVAKGTAWEQHYQSPAVHDAVMSELRRLFHTSMHVDRMAHAMKNPHCPHAALYTSKVT